MTGRECNGDTPEFVRPGISCNRVLVAEDDTMFRRILQSWLENWGYKVTLAGDGERAWKILQQDFPPQLLIFDWVMPGINGLELCRMVRERNQSPYQYVLLATANDAKQDLVRGLEAGADDYLTKPFDRNELQARLRACNRILTLQDSQIRAQEQLRFQATHDQLTGVLNRAEIMETLRRELQRAAQSSSALGVLMLDVDHFKKINDSYGHITGDSVLKQVTQRITASVRGYDSVGRYGGEEFVVVMPGCTREQIDQSAERVRAAVDDGPVLVDESKIFVTVSIGAGVVTNGSTSDSQILAAADRALYRAKEIGRNRTVLADLAVS
ncbi:MAG: diguanylate cyclase [Acidobacteriaceae bacterium]